MSTSLFLLTKISETFQRLSFVIDFLSSPPLFWNLVIYSSLSFYFSSALTEYKHA